MRAAPEADLADGANLPATRLCASDYLERVTALPARGPGQTDVIFGTCIDLHCYYARMYAQEIRFIPEWAF